MDIYLAKIHLSFSAQEGIILNTFVAQHFNTPLLPPTYNFEATINFINNDVLLGFSPVIKGRPYDDNKTPNIWAVYKKDEDLAIEIIYINHERFKRSVSILSLHNNTLAIYVEPISPFQIPYEIDPLDPAISLNMLYISSFTNSFLVHASGVLYDGKGHLFTAVSGTGKSTMAKLWDKRGATIVNDDRLWITKIDNKWYMFNTPMVWYAQYPHAAPIDSIYLIRQSPKNELQELSGVTPAMQFMSNCQQHHFDKAMSSNFLDMVLDLSSNTPIYDLGFKPDLEVVDLLIKNIEGR